MFGTAIALLGLFVGSSLPTKLNLLKVTQVT